MDTCFSEVRQDTLWKCDTIDSKSLRGRLEGVVELAGEVKKETVAGEGDKQDATSGVDDRVYCLLLTRRLRWGGRVGV